MSDQYNKMIEEFKEIAELKAFAYAQSKTITEQAKKITKLEAEVKELSKDKPKESLEIKSDLLIGTDQEVIAKIQLSKLKDVCFERELTLDECKRAEILVKILNSNKKKDKDSDKVDEPLSLDELMQAVRES